MPTLPTPPIELTGHESHFGGDGTDLPDEFVDVIAHICEVVSDDDRTLLPETFDQGEDVPSQRVAVVLPVCCRRGSRTPPLPEPAGTLG